MLNRKRIHIVTEFCLRWLLIVLLPGMPSLYNQECKRKLVNSQGADIRHWMLKEKGGEKVYGKVDSSDC